MKCAKCSKEGPYFAEYYDMENKRPSLVYFCAKHCSEFGKLTQEFLKGGKQ